jgi:hypothetical protein
MIAMGTAEAAGDKAIIEHVKQAAACRMSRLTANSALIGDGLPVRSFRSIPWRRSTSARRPSGTRRTGRGRLLPPGINSIPLNDALLAIAQQTGHEWTRQIATLNCALMPS